MSHTNNFIIITLSGIVVQTNAGNLNLKCDNYTGKLRPKFKIKSSNPNATNSLVASANEPDDLR